MRRFADNDTLANQRVHMLRTEHALARLEQPAVNEFGAPVSAERLQRLGDLQFCAKPVGIIGRRRSHESSMRLLRTTSMAIHGSLVADARVDQTGNCRMHNACEDLRFEFEVKLYRFHHETRQHIDGNGGRSSSVRSAR